MLASVRFYISLLSVLFLTSAATAQPKPRPPMPGHKMRVKIDSAPQQAAVYVDSKDYGIEGYTPVTLKLPKGTYTIILELPNFQTVQKAITVEKSQAFVFTMERQVRPAILDVRAPAGSDGALGAQLFVDGSPVGTVPGRVEVAQGHHLIEVKKPGFKDWRDSADVNEGEQRTMVVDLQAEDQKGHAARDLGRAAPRGDGNQGRRRVAPDTVDVDIGARHVRGHEQHALFDLGLQVHHHGALLAFVDVGRVAPILEARLLHLDEVVSLRHLDPARHRPPPATVDDSCAPRAVGARRRRSVQDGRTHLALHGEHERLRLLDGDVHRLEVGYLEDDGVGALRFKVTSRCRSPWSQEEHAPLLRRGVQISTFILWPGPWASAWAEVRNGAS